MVIDAIPLTATGKTDRAKLPVPPAEDAGQLTPPETELEAQLAAIWKDTLKLPTIGTNQNFFQIGGDSILSLQIVARARQAGLHITPGDLFRHQTIAELATVARHGRETAETPAEASGPAPLTPIQSWFFDEPIPHRGHWNQQMVLRPQSPLDAALLREAFGCIVGHHQALRLRFWKDESGWCQEPASPDAASDLVWQRSATSNADLAALFAEANGSLDLAAGRLLRAVLATFPDGGQRLLLAIHHLAVDGVSWRFLVEDLEAAYRALSGGQPVSLPPRTASFPQWALRVAEQAARPALAGETDYWTRLTTGVAPLPQDNPAGANHREHAKRITARLPAGITSQLLAAANTAYRTRPDELMLTALARTAGRWTGQPEILIDLENHGRDLPGANLDVSRTVGWFTTVFPVRLGVHGDVPRAIKSVKEAVRRTPGNGAGYGLLRHLSPPETRARLAALPRAQIAFNYLGRIGSFSSGLFVADAASMDLSNDATAPLGPLITIDAFADDDGLSLRWTYSGEIYRTETVEGLAGSMLSELTAIIGHCTAESVEGVTPADFPGSGLTQAQLDRLALPWRRIEDVHRLTALQQGMLFYGLYAPEENAYVNQLRLTIHGLDPARFIAAWRAALARHGTLRSGFIRDDDLDAPLQVVHRAAELPVHEEDWRGRAATDADLAAFAAGQRRSFDLAVPPLMRLAFIRTGETCHHMVWTCHHLLLDGWSSALLLAEVLRLYAAPSVKLPPATFRFRDYVAWLEARDSVADERFWREKLRGLEEPTLIAEAFTGMAEVAGNDTRTTGLDADRMTRLTAFARTERITLNTLIQAAWLLTLKRYTARNTLCFGMTVAGRPPELPGIEAALGLFINTVPVTAAIEPNASVGEWLRSLQADGTQLREHEYAPLMEIQRWAGQGGRALFDSLLVFENYPVDAALRSGEIAGLRFETAINSETTNYPLTLSVFAGEHAGLQWSYARRSFTGGEIARIERQFLHALEMLTGNAGQPVGGLALAVPEEMQAATAQAAARRTFVPLPLIHERFAAQAKTRPNAVALTLDNESLIYAALEEHANRLANRLIAAGVMPGDFVGLAAERSFELIVGILAVLKAGAAYVPLDPAYPMERLAFMAGDAKLAALLTAPELAERLAQNDLPVIALDEAASAQYPDAAPEIRVSPASPAYVIYTSGSTGKPKGVVVSHENAARLLTATQDWFRFGPDDVWTLFHSYAFDFSVWEIFGALCHGGRLVIVPHIVSRSPAEFLDLLVRERVSVLNQTPSAFRQLMRAATETPEKPNLALRSIVFGGEALEVAALRPWFERFGDSAPRLINMYGITETTVHVTYRPILADDLSSGAKSPIGEPIPDLTLYVLDDALDPAPIGVAGELYVGGAGLASAYFGRPGLTAERFLPDPFGGKGGRLYRTGDKAMRMADGGIEYLGRLDSQVKIRGFRIELGEIEARLLAEPGIRETAVILRDGGGGPQLFAYVVTSGPIAQDDIKASLRRQMPDYMVPLHILAIPAIPLTENGKLDRRALPMPRATTAERQAPRTETERKLVGIWRDVLGVESVGLEDNFFDLGGHSLLAVQMHLQIGREFGIELPLRTLFEARSLSGLAEAIDTLRAGDDAEAQALREMAALMDELEG
jgi:amino acid adenylation domain-containing protein/non-ribosomal peptide synthase protein (TIGR01720 family)